MPSVRQIVKLTGYESTSAVTFALGHLEKLGLIDAYRSSDTRTSFRIAGASWAPPARYFEIRKLMDQGKEDQLLEELTRELRRIYVEEQYPRISNAED